MFETQPILLKELLKKVESCEIQLPDFQRGWIWDDDRVRGLLASISQGFPIGAVMMLKSGGNIKFKCRPIEGVCSSGCPQEFLLDGQQRLTSLYQALSHKDPVNTQDSRGKSVKRWYYVDMIKALDLDGDREDAIKSVPEDKKIRSNFGRNVDIDLSNPELEYVHHMVPTEQLLNVRNWWAEYNLYWSKNNHPKGNVANFLKEFDKILDNFSDYLLPVITLKKETPKEAVCIVFEKVNTGGVSLTTFELVTAVFAADNFSLRDDWDERRERLHEKEVLQGIEGEQFLQAITLLATQQSRIEDVQNGSPAGQAPAISCKKRDVLNLSLIDYKRWAGEVEEGFIKAAKFLRRQFVFAQRDVPYNTQLVPLAALYVELGDELESDNAKKRLEHWYWSGIFSEEYGSSVETQFALDLEEVAEYIRKEASPKLVREANFVPERLVSLRSKNSAAYKGLYALQMKSAAADWRTGDPLTFPIWDDERIDIHHIFPKAWCRKNNIPKPLYDSVINKTPIDAKTNRIIGGKPPSVYLAQLDKQVNGLDQVLKKHWLKPQLLRADKFGESFVERGQKMFELINKAMGKQQEQIVDSKASFKKVLDSYGIKTGIIYNVRQFS